MLEIGSIVVLKEGAQKLMIVSRGAIIKPGKDREFFDYSACKYPIGVDGNSFYYFNEENIEKVIFQGFHDADEDELQKLYQEWKKQDHSAIVQGRIDHSLEENSK